MDKIRPRSVTIIAWVIIILGCLTVYSVLRLPQMLTRPEYSKIADLMGESLKITVLISSTYAVLFLVSGTAMLKGFNWGRLLYLWSYGVIVLFNIISSGFSLMVLPSVVVYTTFFIFLTRPVAKEFFKSSKKKEENKEGDKESQGLSI